MPNDKKKLSVADIQGDWIDSNFESSLIERCKNAWCKPLDILTNKEMATFLQQRIAVGEILPLALKRLKDGFDDETEFYDGELKEVVEKLSKG